MANGTAVLIAGAARSLHHRRAATTAKTELEAWWSPPTPLFYIKYLRTCRHVRACAYRYF